MKALVFDRSLRYDANYPEPDAALGDTLIEVRQAGVCSTDIEITRGYMNYTGVIGHEFVGTVVSSSQSQLVGKRVCGEINCVCGRCDMCVGGLPNHCRARSVLGILNHSGALAERLRLPAENIHPLPDSVDDDQAVFVEPLAAAIATVKGTRIDPHSWVTVLGDGRLGLLVAQVLRNRDCQVRLVGKHPQKLALCEKWQIRSRKLTDIKPRADQDVVIDCTGSAGGLELAMAMTRPRGTIVLKSTVAVAKPVDLSPIVINELNIVGSRCGSFRDAIEMLLTNTIDVVSLISRRFRLEEGVEAVEAAGRADVLKVIVSVDRQ